MRVAPGVFLRFGLLRLGRTLVAPLFPALVLPIDHRLKLLLMVGEMPGT
jgi:hypothetical protein